MLNVVCDYKPLVFPVQVTATPKLELNIRQTWNKRDPYKNTANVGIAHTHAAYNSELKGGDDLFSQRDIDIYIEQKQLGYVATPSGELREYNPSTAKEINLTASSDPAFKNIPSDQQDPAHTNRVDARNPNLPKNEPSKSTFMTVMTVIFNSIFKK